jgi:hypothetical protein
MSSNEKTQNYKVIDLIESYNFDINFIFVQHRRSYTILYSFCDMEFSFEWHVCRKVLEGCVLF